MLDKKIGASSCKNAGCPSNNLENGLESQIQCQQKVPSDDVNEKYTGGILYHRLITGRGE